MSSTFMEPYSSAGQPVGRQHCRDTTLIDEHDSKASLFRYEERIDDWASFNNH